MSATFRFIELVGTSTKSWEDAALRALEDAQVGVKGLRVAEVSQMDIKNIGDVMAFRVRLKASFKVSKN